MRNVLFTYILVCCGLSSSAQDDNATLHRESPILSIISIDGKEVEIKRSYSITPGQHKAIVKCFASGNSAHDMYRQPEHVAIDFKCLPKKNTLLSLSILPASMTRL